MSLSDSLLSRAGRLLALAAVAAFLAASCATEQAPAATQTPSPLIEARLITGPVSGDGVQAILGTSDLGVGKNRVGFVLQTEQELVSTPQATVRSLFFAGEGMEGEVVETATARFRLWPYGTRGMYTTNLTFDKPGRWGLEISVPTPDGGAKSALVYFHVAESPQAPAVGALAPLVETKTVNDVTDLRELTTGYDIDPDLYQVSLAEAVKSGVPTVVVFNSPAYCSNAVCGPQTDVLTELKDAYRGQANFLHLDIYDNPQEIQGDLSRARIGPPTKEWRLPSIEWTFVIGRDGRIAARFEAFATFEEMEEALLRALS